MTGTLLDYDPNDTGDIPPIDSLGVEPTRDLVEPTRDLSAHLHRRDTTDELTQNLAHEMAGLPPRRRPDATGEFPRLIDVPLGMLEGPQKPPPPLPKPKDLAETGVNIFGGLGEHLPEGPDNYVGRHRHPEDLAPVEDVAPAVAGRYWEMRRPSYERRLSPRWALAGVVVAGLAIWAGLILAAVAVFL